MLPEDISLFAQLFSKLKWSKHLALWARCTLACARLHHPTKDGHHMAHQAQHDGNAEPEETGKDKHIEQATHLLLHLEEVDEMRNGPGYQHPADNQSQQEHTALLDCVHLVS